MTQMDDVGRCGSAAALRPFGLSRCASQAKPAAAIARREWLSRLYYEGKPFRVIAQEYGGTPQGVRSTVRKMIERGELIQRQQPQNGGMRR